jgi:hypothetical protein
LSRYIRSNKDGTYTIVIESMEICRWRYNDICVNDKCEELGDFPYPSCKCENRPTCKHFCKNFEKEDGIIKGDDDSVSKK